MLSREEIARQFQLPERKSKIATLLKQDGQVYCVCRSTDSSRFMIGCDLCEEWFHGDCIGISKKDAKNIKQYFCEKCQLDDPTLSIVFKSSKPSGDSDDAFEMAIPKPRPPKREHKTLETKISKKYKSGSSKSGGCGECSNCCRNSNCGTCKNCKDSRKHSRKPKEKCLMRICKRKKTSSHGTKRKGDDSDSEEEVLVGGAYKPGMQCYGPGCTLSALPNSKYCSTKCGVKLATNRIFHVLPQRLQDQSISVSLAEEHDKKELESIREKLAMARSLLQDLDRQHQKLDKVIERAKNIYTDEDEDKYGKSKRKETEEESSIYCVTCGHEIHTGSALKHMEKCFNKYESQASFGSIYKTRIEGNNMFCDFYNPANRTYCKRLRVLCPEHQKDPKIDPNEVCGCPYVKNVFEVTNEICREPKKYCQRHHCWEKLRRAEIDMERVRQWLKIDELLEQERQVKQKMSQRAGVLALMLHSTYDHDANKQEEELRMKQEEEMRMNQLSQAENYDKEQFENIQRSSKNKKHRKSSQSRS
uniref:CXXC-type zinc finger protein 1 n=1 Tax=Lygus hesperus TaxID=30085 RepID=A0A146M154_LYGHE